MNRTPAMIGAAIAALITGTSLLAPLGTAGAAGPAAEWFRPPLPCVLVKARVVPPRSGFCRGTSFRNVQKSSASFAVSTVALGLSPAAADAGSAAGDSAADAATLESAVTAADEFLSLLSEKQRVADGVRVR